MVRSSFIVVSDDQSLIQKAQQFAQMHGVSCQVMTPDQYQAAQNRRPDVPSLVPGQWSVEGAKVLPFPGTAGVGQVGSGPTDSRRNNKVTTINQMESAAIANAISAFKGNLTEAAKALGIGRATLYRKVKQYNLDPATARKKKAA
jgi:transcriptional regulator with GAF, ATPase, and Fis domain